MNLRIATATTLLVGAAVWTATGSAQAQEKLAQDKAAAASADAAFASMAVDRVSSPTDSATAVADAALAVNRVNGGASFWMICRGGPGLRIRSDGIMMDAPVTMNLPPWAVVSMMVMDFSHSPLPPDHSGRNLQPGQCSPEQFQFRDADPTQLRSLMVLHGQWQRTMQGLPEDTSANVAEKYPDIINMPPYLGDPNHYWRFGAADTGETYLEAGYSRFWATSMYQGRPPESPTAKASSHGSERLIDVASAGATETTARSDAVRAAVMTKTDPTICISARSARARNSPAAPGLERQCRAAGGTP